MEISLDVNVDSGFVETGFTCEAGKALRMGHPDQKVESTLKGQKALLFPEDAASANVADACPFGTSIPDNMDGQRGAATDPEVRTPVVPFVWGWAHRHLGQAIVEVVWLILYSLWQLYWLHATRRSQVVGENKDRRRLYGHQGSAMLQLLLADIGNRSGSAQLSDMRWRLCRCLSRSNRSNASMQRQRWTVAGNQTSDHWNTLDNLRSQ